MEILRSISGIKFPNSVSDIYEGLGSGVIFNRSAGLVAVPTDNYSVQICERIHQPGDKATVAVIGETLEPIMTLSFVGKSTFLVSASHGSNPQLTLWSMSKLSIYWSYKLHVEDITFSLDCSTFAVLAFLPKTSECVESTEPRLHGVDGAILLFNVENPVPLGAWFVSKAQGGRLGFIQTSPKLEDEVAESMQPRGKRKIWLCIHLW